MPDPALITTLIDWADGFELVRDKVVEILSVELINQQNLAEDAGEDPDDWTIDVYTERSENIDECFESNGKLKLPLVNVWFESSDHNPSTSAVRGEQATSIINIDCYGFGISRSSIGGHIAADYSAAIAAQRCARLVRNILMSEHYFVLGSPRKSDQWIFGRKVRSITAFQVENKNASHAASGIRLALEVRHKIQVPIIEGEQLETISTLLLQPDGRVLLGADYQK